MYIKGNEKRKDFLIRVLEVKDKEEEILKKILRYMKKAEKWKVSELCYFLSDESTSLFSEICKAFISLEKEKVRHSLHLTVNGSMSGIEECYKGFETLSFICNVNSYFDLAKFVLEKKELLRIKDACCIARASSQHITERILVLRVKQIYLDIRDNSSLKKSSVTKSIIVLDYYSTINVKIVANSFFRDNNFLLKFCFSKKFRKVQFYSDFKMLANKTSCIFYHNRVVCMRLLCFDETSSLLTNIHPRVAQTLEAQEWQLLLAIREKQGITTFSKFYDIERNKISAVQAMGRNLLSKKRIQFYRILHLIRN